MAKTKKTVHVCAWDYEGGGGFDWYRSDEGANTAFEKEKNNCNDLAAENFRAYRFDVEVLNIMSDDDVTNFIDSNLRHYCDEAKTTYQAGRALSDLYALWDELGNIPTIFDGENVDTIQESFLHFPIGVHREVIWHWFEERNPRFVVGDVMHGIRVADTTPSNDGPAASCAM